MIQKFFLVVALSIFSHANEIIWEDSLKDTVGHKTFVLVEESYCPWCSRFKQRVLSDKEVKNALAPYKKIIMMKNSWNQEGIAHVRFVPTIIITDGNRGVIARHDGYADKDEFLEFLKWALVKSTNFNKKF